MTQFSTAPYPGLRPFDTEEQDIFFGREAQTDELLQKLHAGRFLAVVGPSGCGKSSLVRAGLIASLETGLLASAGSRWRIAGLRPGRHPFKRLAHRLAAVEAVESPASVRPNAEMSIEAALRRGPLGLIDCVKESPAAAASTLLLLVDQFEEVFRFRAEQSADEAEAFVNMLLATAGRTDVPVYIVLTMRSDFLGQCGLFHGLPEAIGKSQYLTPRLSREECALAIAGPARVFGGEIDPALVHRLVNDLEADTDQLPIMQHALMRMWNHEKARRGADGGRRIVLTVEHYEAIGGLARALSNHADEAYFELSEKQRRLARVLFQRISNRTAGQLDTRSPARVEDIAGVAETGIAEVISVAEVFRRSDRCFLTPPAGEPLDGDSFLDVSHESFIAHWDRLSDWAREESESATIYLRLRQEAALWKAKEAALWGSPNLERALDWKARTTPNATWATRYGSAAEFEVAMDFLAESEARRHQEQALKAAERDRALRRARLTAVVSGVTAGVLLSAIALYAYLRVLERPTYYRDFETAYGVARGIGLLGPDDVKHRARSYRIVKRGRWGPVLRVESVDGRGQLVRGISTFLDPEPGTEDLAASCDYVYDNQGRIVASFAYDAFHAPIWGVIYVRGTAGGSGATIYKVGADGTPAPKAPLIAIQYTPRGYERLLRYYDRAGVPVRGRDRAFGVEREYDSLGRLSRITSLDPEGKPMNDSFGNATLRLAYDSAGNQVLDIAQGADGKPIPTVQGWATLKYTYDGHGNALSEAYFDVAGRPTIRKEGYQAKAFELDDRGNQVLETYRSEASQPATDDQGCYGVRSRFDDRGNRIADTCLGATGQPVSNKHGYSTAEVTYNDHDEAVELVYRDPAGRECPSDDGYSRKRISYDSSWHIAGTKYFGPDGQPVPISDGYAEERLTNDRDGHALLREYFSADGAPAATKDGWARETAEYDAFGNVLRRNFFDAAGAPAHTSVGNSGWRARYDPRGNEIEHEFSGPRGERVSGSDGYAGWRAEFDERGNQTRLAYFATTGEPAAAHGGVAGWTSTYNNRGDEISLRFFGVNGSPATHSDGFAGWDADYNDRRQETERRYVDVHGGRALYRWDGAAQGSGYARVKTAFDARGNTTEQCFFGTHDEAVLGKDGYACDQVAYDTSGHLAHLSYFGAYGQPILIEGYHLAKFVSDEHGNVTDVTYFGLDETSPALSKEGCTHLVKTFDRYGHVKQQRAFDHDAPARFASGCHVETFTYDAAGHMTSQECLDARGQRELGADGSAVTLQKFDAAGRIEERSLHGIHDELVVGSGGYATLQWEYDPRGNAIVIRSLDAAGHLVVDKTGNAVLRKRYDLQNRPVEETAYGPNDEQLTTPQGYWKDLSEYDERGRIIRSEYRDTKDRPVVVPSFGYASVRSEYDERGHETSRDLFDASGKPVVGGEGFSRLVHQYNERGQELEISLYDASSPRRLVAGEQRFARRVQVYDDHGRLTEITTYDAANNLVVSKSGYARMTRTYDERDNLVEEAYFGRDGAPFGNETASRATFGYDALDNRVEERDYDEKGALILRCTWKYDGQRRKVEARYFGADGMPALLGGRGQHVTLYEYDNHGNKTGATFLGVKGEAVLGYEEKVWCRKWSATYDEDGKRTHAGCAAPTGEQASR